MATKAKVASAPKGNVKKVAVDDFDPFAVATENASDKKSSKEKRTIINKTLTDKIKNLFLFKNLQDQAEQRFKEERDNVLREAGIPNFFDGPDAESFILADGEGGSVMIAPVDKCKKVDDDDRMNYLNETYGKDTVKKSWEFSFAEEVLSDPTYGKAVMEAVKNAIAGMDMPIEMKKKVFKAKPIRSVAKDMPERLRAMYAKNPDLAKVALEDLGMQFQVKTPKYDGLDAPALGDLLESVK